MKNIRKITDILMDVLVVMWFTLLTILTAYYPVILSMGQTIQLSGLFLVWFWTGTILVGVMCIGIAVLTGRSLIKKICGPKENVNDQ